MSDPRQRFSDRADAYVKARPGYPDEAFAEILRGLGPPEHLTCADIGAGTGISSLQMASRGVRVFAIEPNDAMRETGSRHGGITWLAGSAEQTGLDDASVDIVLAAQAFHWFRASESLREFHRVLRPGGRVALIWNIHDPSDGFVRAYRQVILAHAKDPPRSPWFTNEPCALAESPLFNHYRLRSFHHAQTLDRHGLLARAESSSYLPRSGEAYDSLRRELIALFEAHSLHGRIQIPYVTEVHLAERA